MSEPRLEWERVSDDWREEEWRAQCGEHHSVSVLNLVDGWHWYVRAEHRVIGNSPHGEPLRDMTDAQLAAEDALREVLTTALRALEGVGDE
jgi:hypothetical protein